MSALSDLLELPETEKEARGLSYTPREIFQQPATWETTGQIFRERRDEIAAFLSSAGVLGPGAGSLTVYLVGAGTSDYIGRSLTRLLRKQWRCEVQAVPSTDLLTNFDEFVLAQRSYLLISFSRSGDSPEGVAVLEQALRNYPAMRHVIVSCNRAGRMMREFTGRENVCGIVLDEAVNDRGLAMTSSFTNMVVTGQLLAHTFTLTAYERILAELCEAGSRFLPNAVDAAFRLAVKDCAQVIFVGTGALNAVARESALKALEMTAGRVCTMSETSLGIRHGPLSALHKGTLLVSYLSGDPRRQSYELDLLAEIRRKQLGRAVIAISPNGEAAAAALVDTDLALGISATFSDDYRPPLDVMFGQVFGLFSSLTQGLKPDAPSPDGAISRVVSQVKIYR